MDSPHFAYAVRQSPWPVYSMTTTEQDRTAAADVQLIARVIAVLRASELAPDAIPELAALRERLAATLPK